MAGNKPVVEFVSEHLFDMTVGDLIYRLHDVEGVEGDQGQFVFDDVLPDILPRLPVKFKGKDWTYQMARKCLTRYMNPLRFYRGSKKTYKRSSVKPFTRELR